MTAAAPPRPGRILALMCVLIAVNQFGFGGIVPALALYARSYGVAFLRWAPETHRPAPA